jgi:hypothetical protein
MATTLQEIDSYLKDGGLNANIQEEEEYISTGYPTDSYVDIDGGNGVPIVINLEDDGKFLSVLVPTLYEFNMSENLSALTQTCLEIAERTKMVKFFITDDGHVRMQLDLLLEDSSLTPRQLFKMIGTLVGTANRFHVAFLTAAKTGKVTVDETFKNEEQKERLKKLLEEASPEEVQKLLAQAEFNKGARMTANEACMAVH